ncbi:MAG: glycosyltransferase family 39 protein [Armatimonadota bacterium]|nr:glycosyltransferase family 39 protein [Armatimonadota bacterium]MDR7443726.1 glycosyltransferase family 39 protein [Armatimonadota bacterium]MDR7569923.1 glycosyltransferase family 39 protein [Armatimonadota bacterium]MDR7613746.1 glycosyltransferase family 39 protein [Armatimonadota bacterium]
MRNLPAACPWVLRATASVAVATLARFLLAASLPLLDDEAYYWVWSKHLAWGYLDHPPGIAVAIAASTARFGDLPWAIRLPALLCGLGTAFLTWRMTLESTRDPRSAYLAVLLLQTVPLFSLGAALAAPDGLLAFFWMLSSWALWRAVHGAPGYWLVVGLGVGLGMQSKYTMALFLPAALAAFLRSPNSPRSPFPYAAAALALLLIGPNLAWNVKNGWAAVLYAFGRDPWLPPRNPAVNLTVYAAAVLLYLSPVLGVLLLSAPLRLRAAGADFLRWLAVPTLLALLVASLLGKAKPHYILPAALVGVLALAQDHRFHTARTAGIWLGGAMGAVAVGMALFRAIPAPDLYGWPQVTERIRVLARGRPLLLIATTYQEGAQLAYATHRRYPVVVLPGKHAFAQWSPLQRWQGWDGLFVHDRRNPPADPYGNWCRETEVLPPSTLPVPGGIREFTFVRCLGFHPRTMAP